MNNDKQLELPYTRMCNRCGKYHKKVLFHNVDVIYIWNDEYFKSGVNHFPDGVWLCPQCFKDIDLDVCFYR